MRQQRKPMQGQTSFLRRIVQNPRGRQFTDRTGTGSEQIQHLFIGKGPVFRHVIPESEDLKPFLRFNRFSVARLSETFQTAQFIEVDKKVKHIARVAFIFPYVKVSSDIEK